MKSIAISIILSSFLSSCDIDHHVQWEIRNAPRGSDRNRKVMILLSEEATRLGLIKQKTTNSRILLSYKDITDFHYLSAFPVIEASSTNDEVIISLNTGFDPTISNKESFKKVSNSIDEALKREIKVDIYRKK